LSIVTTMIFLFLISAFIVLSSKIIFTL
jgi:hypothetical protein